VKQLLETFMSILTIGINHTTAPVAIREQVMFGPDVIVAGLRSLCDLSGVNEGVILSTCNRTEIYCQCDSDQLELVQKWLVDFHELVLADISPFLYSYNNDRAIEHLLTVSCGLDSMVIGEPQILGQVKAAYQTSLDAGHTGKILDRLFQHAFTTAKQVRTDTAIGDNPVSIAFAAVSLARQIFSDISKQTALLVGAGEAIELAAKHLDQHGIGKIIVANRTLKRAKQLADQFGGDAIGLTELSSRLYEADIVITSTASPIPIIGKGMIERALKVRKRRPIFMVDIAVPRDIEPEAKDLRDIYLYSVDELEVVINETLQTRAEAAEQAQEIISFQVNEFKEWLGSLDAVDVIAEYRASAEILRDQVLLKAQRMLETGKNPEEVLDYLAKTLTNKLLHIPSIQLRNAGSMGKHDLLKAANTLFQLSVKKNND